MSQIPSLFYAAPNSRQGKVEFEEVIGQEGVDGETVVVHAVPTTSRPSEMDEEGGPGYPCGK